MFLYLQLSISIRSYAPKDKNKVKNKVQITLFCVEIK